MNENTKTILFTAAALLFAAIGFATLPKTQSANTRPEIGQKIFPDFKEATDAASLEIVKFDEKIGDLEDFRVAKKNGLWVMPSKDDYPADAETADALGAAVSGA